MLPVNPNHEPSNKQLFHHVPEHWTIRRIRTIAEMRVSNVDKHTNEQEIPVRLCNYVDVYYHDHINSDLPYMYATASYAEVQRFRLKPNDVLITKDSETWNDIAVPALVTDPPNDLICGYHLAILRPTRAIEGAYLARALQTRPVAHQFHVKARGITRYGLSHDDILSTSVPLPPLEEQRAIVRYLDHTDEIINRYISAKERLIALLEEQRQAVIHQAVTRGLDPKVTLKPSGASWLGNVPQHWASPRLRYLGDAIIGLTYDPQDVTDVQGGLLVFRASNIHDGRIQYEDQVHVRTKVPNHLITRPGDVLICSRSGSRALIGKNAKIDEHSAGNTFGAFMTLFRSEHNDYLHYVFNSKIFEYQSAMFATSTVNQLTLGMLNSMKMPFPPPHEREKIVDYLDQATVKLDRAIIQTKHQIQLIAEYRTRLIADVVTGQIDVRDTVLELPDQHL